MFYNVISLQEFIVIHLVKIDQQVKCTSSKSTNLSKDDVLSHTSKTIVLRGHGGLEEHLAGFFEGASFECRGVGNSVNTVSVDGDDFSLVAHPVDQHAHMSVVDVDLIFVEAHIDFLDHGLSSCFDSQDTGDFLDIVGGSSDIVNI